MSIFLVYLALAIREPSPAIHSNRGDVNVVQGIDSRISINRRRIVEQIMRNGMADLETNSSSSLNR